MWIEDVTSSCSFRYFSTVILVISNSNFRLDQCYLSFFKCAIIIIVRFMGLWLNNDSDNPCQVLFHRIIISMLSFKVVDSHKNPQKANQFINLSLKT